jgi:hypothetical protein
MRNRIVVVFALLAAASVLEACGGGPSKGASNPSGAEAQPTSPAVATSTTSAPAVSTPDPGSSPTLNVNIRLKEDVTDGARPTEFQSSRLVGHYSTRNGKVGFILDRTTNPPKIRIDADPYVLVLTPRQASKGWLEYVAANIWLRIDEESGSILSFVGPGMNDASRVVRDADARPLPMP